MNSRIIPEADNLKLDVAYFYNIEIRFILT